MTVESLEDIVRRLADRDAIRHVIASYAVHVDSRNFTAWQDLFAEDGGYGPADNRIAKPLLAVAGAAFLAPYPSSHHFLGESLIDVTGDTAIARVGGISHHVSAAAHPSRSSIVGGWLMLELRRASTGWLIVSAESDTVWTEGDDYFAAAAGVFEAFKRDHSLD